MVYWIITTPNGGWGDQFPTLNASVLFVKNGTVNLEFLGYEPNSTRSGAKYTWQVVYRPECWAYPTETTTYYRYVHRKTETARCWDPEGCIIFFEVTHGVMETTLVGDGIHTARELAQTWWGDSHPLEWYLYDPTTHKSAANSIPGTWIPKAGAELQLSCRTIQIDAEHRVGYGERLGPSWYDSLFWKPWP